MVYRRISATRGALLLGQEDASNRERYPLRPCTRSRSSPQKAMRSSAQVLAPNNNTMISSMPESLRRCGASMRSGVEIVIMRHRPMIEKCRSSTWRNVGKQRAAHRVDSKTSEGRCYAIHPGSDLEQVVQPISRHDRRTGHGAMTSLYGHADPAFDCG